jgi:hypothetical protein
MKLLGRKTQTNLYPSQNTILINISEEVNTLHLLSDKCAGKNKNILMAQFLNSLTASGRFLEVHHHLPERGHLFKPCDWTFA